MQSTGDLAALVARLEERLDTIDRKLDGLASTRRKSFEWLEQMSEHVRSLDIFREEVRATLEPVYDKLQNIDDVMRIMRHATSDVSRRLELLERRRLAG